MHKPTISLPQVWSMVAGMVILNAVLYAADLRSEVFSDFVLGGITVAGGATLFSLLGRC
jgi:hypothetical protein